MNLEDLNPAQIEEHKECHSAEEVLAYVKKYGLKLSDEQLSAVSGGWELDGNKDSSHYVLRGAIRQSLEVV